MNPPEPAIHVVPSFHYDVAYLKSYEEYLPQCMRIINEALHILEESPDYRFLIEQVILLEEFWERHPEQRARLVQFAREGRLAVAPGMYVMPDMNHPDGESMFVQIKLGKAWLREHLGLDPKVCWIADCWGHHAQLPQILTQAGYADYVFWRCMRRDVQRNDFHWQGLDGTSIRTHWLARGYSSLRFPSTEAVVNAPDLSLIGCGAEQIHALCDELQQYGPSESLMLCNGGDFMMPQASAPQVLERLNQSGEVPSIRFSTPEEFVESASWERMPQFEGEFNSAFQGTFTSNIKIKQLSRQLVRRLLTLETLSVLTRTVSASYDGIWRMLLKQQFHDIICGTITDKALEDCYREFDSASRMLGDALGSLSSEEGQQTAINPLAFDRQEVVPHGDTSLLVNVPPLGCTLLDQAEALEAEPCLDLPCVFENNFYRAEISSQGFITSLVEKTTNTELVDEQGVPFGSMGMQMDYGDLWLNFESPLNGGSLESSLTQNHPDPLHRSTNQDIVNRQTFLPAIRSAKVTRRNAGELVLEQEGRVGFWLAGVPFRTQIRFLQHCPRIEYSTTIEPSGKHYRLRALFPTPIQEGCIRHEIPFGIQERGQHEHVAQGWIDYASAEAGIALLNRGIPGNNVHEGVLMLSLFRSAAMEYKAPSEASFNEGRPHTFEYAIMPHASGADVSIIQNAQAFATPLAILDTSIDNAGWNEWRLEPEHVFLSALRWSDKHIFVRCYEAVGTQEDVSLHVPKRITHYALADGLEQPIADFQPCDGVISFRLNPFEIAGFLLCVG